MPGFIEEFKRRNIFRVAMAYLVITWLVLQVADTAAPLLGLPEWVNSLILFILALLFIPTLIFAWAFELTPEGIKSQAEVDREQSITGETGKKLNYVTIGALALVLVVVASDRWLFPEATVAEPAAAAASLEPGEVSIAVLPFADMSPNNDQEYFSDGISEEILNGLAKLKTMKVAGRTSAFAFKGRNEDLREIGAALGVEHVLEGSVRKSGNQLRITAQLVKVSDGFHLWSDTYDRELDDVFAIQDEISSAIVKELQGSLLGDGSAAVSEDVIDVATFEKFLAARKLIHSRTNEDLTEAMSMLEEIVDVAPDFAPGLSSLAETLVLLRGSSFNAYGDLDPQMVRERATQLLERAIELDPDLADAHATLGLLQYDDRQYGVARESLLRAVELNPSLSKAWVWLSNVAGAENDAPERRKFLERATAIDPLWLVPNSNLVYVNLEFGQIDEVWEVLERLRPFHQESAMFHSLDGQAHASVGDLAGAHRSYERAYALSPDTPSFGSRLGFNLIALQNFEAALDAMPQQFALAANFVSGEWDDVLPTIRERAAADPDPTLPLSIYVLSANYVGDYEGVVEIYDQKVKSPDWMMERNMQGMMLEFIRSFRGVGRDEDAQRLLDTYGQWLREEESRGVNNASHSFSWAQYFAYSGEYSEALARLETSIDEGMRIGFWQYLEEFAPLAQDQEFIELQRRNLDAVNASRVDLGWEPVAAIGIFYEPNQD